MRAITKLMTIFGAIAALSGCGGGGSSSSASNGGGNAGCASCQPLASLTISPIKASLPSNRSGFPFLVGSPYTSQVDVFVRRGDGSPAPDAVIVSLSTSNIDIARVNDSINGSCAQIFAGKATFFLGTGAASGNITLRATVGEPLTPGTIDRTTGECRTSFPSNFQQVEKTLPYTVTVGPDPFKLFEVKPLRTSLPVNSGNVSPFLGSPYLTEVQVTKRDIFAAPASGSATISIGPSDRATLATSISGSQTVTAQSVSVPIVAGQGVFYILSKTVAGNATLNGVDNDGNTESQQIAIGSGGGTAVPSSVRILASGKPTYVQGANGSQEQPIQALLFDSSGSAILDGAAGVNNLKIELQTPNGASGESLRATSATGVTQTGTSVNVRTVSGLGLATMRSGTRQGIVYIKATGDRTDNNVDNGIQDPVFAQNAVVVSDGKLFDLKFTSTAAGNPYENPITDGRVILTLPNGSTATNNGSYSYNLSVLATDRQGNPVTQGTTVEFGLVDSPSEGYPTQGPGRFQISGGDGDPQEGGTNFSAPLGEFLTAGGGAGPGDTLVVFAEQSSPNRDLESARTVAQVNSQTSLTVRSRFNFNDDTGVSVNNGPVLPYVVGKATGVANIENVSAVTNDIGVATTRINFAASRLGRAVVVWARAKADDVNGTSEFATTTLRIALPGITGGKVLAQIRPLRANRSSRETVCLKDGSTNPIPGRFVYLAFSQEVVSFTIDGVTGASRSANATGLDGCVDIAINASVTGTTAGKVTFSSSGLDSDTVDIVGAGGRVLIAEPSAFFGGGGDVTLTLLDGDGSPVQGVLITGSCTATNGGLATLSRIPGITNAQGQTTAQISARMEGVNTVPSGDCTFVAAGGSPQAKVSLFGYDVCKILVSPANPLCTTTGGTGGGTTVTNHKLTVRLQGGTAAALTGTQAIVTSNVGGIYCGPGTTVPSCETTLAPATIVQLTAGRTPGGTTPPDAEFCGWAGEPDCTSTGLTVNVSIDSARDKICNAIWRTGSVSATCATLLSRPQ
jgi:hypothetical protein